MDKETVNFILALVAALIALFGYWRSARKGLVDELLAEVRFLKETSAARDESFKAEIAARDVERKKLRNRVRFLTKLLLQRESENNKMASRVKLLNVQVDKIAREHYLATIEVLALRKALVDATGNQSLLGVTAPLPPLFDQEAGSQGP